MQGGKEVTKVGEREREREKARRRRKRKGSEQQKRGSHKEGGREKQFHWIKANVLLSFSDHI